MVYKEHNSPWLSQATVVTSMLSSPDSGMPASAGLQTRFHRLPLKGKYVGPTHEALELDPGGTHQLIEGVVFWELSKDEERLRWVPTNAW